MPSDQHLTASQFDQDGFPIAIGFQPAADSQVEGVLEVQENENEPEGMLDAELPASDDEAEPQEALSGYDLVADMMRRQDEVLEQLDDLNARIELAIKQVSAARKSEIEALEAEGQRFADQQLLEDDNQAMNQQKAA